MKEVQVVDKAAPKLTQDKVIIGVIILPVKDNSITTNIALLSNHSLVIKALMVHTKICISEEMVKVQLTEMTSTSISLTNSPTNRSQGK